MKKETQAKVDAVHAKITDQVVAALENGEATGDWTKAWITDPHILSPMNPITGKRYTAGNRANLAFTAWLTPGYGAHWAGYSQWASLSRHTAACRALTDAKNRKRPRKEDCAELGCELVHVRKGEHSTPGLRPIIRHDYPTPGEDTLVGFAPIVLFNSAQIEGYTEPEPTKIVHDMTVAEQFAEADAYAARIGAVVIESKVDRAAYSPAKDQIEMPAHGKWENPDDYWATLVHELIHWTGHDSRLKRGMFGQGDDAYAREELVAELGAAFHLAHLGRSTVVRESHIKYLRHWIGQLREDPKLLWTAAGQAESASKMLGRLHTTTMMKEEQPA